MGLSCNLPVFDEFQFVIVHNTRRPLQGNYRKLMTFEAVKISLSVYNFISAENTDDMFLLDLHS